MSCAPPPPPPPAAPALPVFTPTATKSKGKDERSQLLDSIRKGTTLKKTVTNDKSAPAIGGSTSAKSSLNINNVATTRTATTNGRQANDVQQPVAGRLGGLFVNGIPKLKPTGSAIGQAYQQYRNESDPPKSSVLVNDKGSNNVNTNFNIVGSLSSKTRGPPPQPPMSTPRNALAQPDVDSRGPTNAISLNENTTNANGYQNRTSNGGSIHTISHGKPSLAPKPPGLKPSINRAQSMRVPRSPLSTTEVKNGSPFADYNRPESSEMNNKNRLPSFHQSHESLSRHAHQSSSPSRTTWSSVSMMNNGNATLRPYNRSHGSPLKPPSTKPPPPPARSAANPPMGPPPPPPTQPPPPPPSHRTNPAPPPPNPAPPPPPSVMQPRLTNNYFNSGAPPMPPTRNSSIRTSNTNSFESRFMALFHSVDEFPPPQPFESVNKIYNSRIQVHKQQAPQPPNHLQSNRVWQACENTSNC